MRPLVLPLAFVAGELWGHTGHGVALSHAMQSAAVSFLAVLWAARVVPALVRGDVTITRADARKEEW